MGGGTGQGGGTQCRSVGALESFQSGLMDYSLTEPQSSQRSPKRQTQMVRGVIMFKTLSPPCLRESPLFLYSVGQNDPLAITERHWAALGDTALGDGTRHWETGTFRQTKSRRNGDNQF